MSDKESISSSLSLRRRIEFGALSGWALGVLTEVTLQSWFQELYQQGVLSPIEEKVGDVLLNHFGDGMEALVGFMVIASIPELIRRGIPSLKESRAAKLAARAFVIPAALIMAGAVVDSETQMRLYKLVEPLGYVSGTPDPADIGFGIYSIIAGVGLYDLVFGDSDTDSHL